MVKRCLAVLACAMLIGCASPTAPDAPWSAAYDADWSAVVDCYTARGLDVGDVARPEVVVRDDCRSKYGAQDFLSQGIWVHGTYSHGVVTVCPDLAALKHEMSHHVAHSVGAVSVNGAGVCWL